MAEKIAAFKAERLTPTVFKIVEFDDVFSEHPFIYVKVLEDVIVVVDTGCGGRSATCDVDVTSLRKFIEEWGVEDNGGRPLNEGGKRRYIVVCTHCHYDHIRELNFISPLANDVVLKDFHKSASRTLPMTRRLSLPLIARRSSIPVISHKTPSASD
jgi:glyoxylase-like metal-dependent hydrolase (beta-lactamase superfamily II)